MTSSTVHGQHDEMKHLPLHVIFAWIKMKDWQCMVTLLPNKQLFLFCCCHWIPENKNYRITTEKHFGDKSVFVYWFGLFLAFARFGNFSPHLFHIFQNHITMSVKKSTKVKQICILIKRKLYNDLLLYVVRYKWGRYLERKHHFLCSWCTNYLYYT